MRAGPLIAARLVPVLFAGVGSGTFRAGTSLVLVNVSVLDGHHRPVNSLGQSQSESTYHKTRWSVPPPPNLLT